MAKKAKKEKKISNPVAKYMEYYNRPKTEPNKKKAMKKGYRKYKGDNPFIILPTYITYRAFFA